ncbi:MAG: helix-turn-helix transcriptional regulator [Pseudomonadota bacterium]
MDTSVQDNLKALRKRSGLSQIELGAVLGCANESTISHLEHRRTEINARTLIAYHILFGIPIENIVPGLYTEIRLHIISRVAAMQEASSDNPEKVLDRVRDEFLEEFRMRQRNKIQYD